MNNKVNFSVPVIFVLISFMALTVYANCSASANDKRNNSSPHVSDKFGLQFSPEEKQWLSEHPIVRVRIGDAPPLHFLEETHKGISVDYLNLIAERAGFQVKYISGIPWLKALDYIKRHEKIDLLITAKKTEEREKYIAFSDDYLFMPWVIFTRLDIGFVGGIMDLSDKTVSVERGYVMHKKLMDEFPDINLLVVETSKEAIEAVALGRADAHIGNLTITSYIIQKYNYNDVKVASPAPFENHNQAMAIRSDWPQLAHIINKTLKSLTPKEHENIRNRWLSVRYEYGISKFDILKWVSAVSLFLLTILGVILFWNRKLNKEIIERKRTDVELNESEKKFRSLVERANDGIAILQNNKIQYANPRLAAILGYSVDEIINTPFSKIVSQDELPALIEKYKKRIAGERVPSIYEASLLHKDGYKVSVELNAGIILFQNKSADLVFARDITERKQAEEALQKSEEKYRLLADNITDNIWVLDLDTQKFKYISPSIVRITGFTVDEVMKLHLKDVLTPSSMDHAIHVLNEELSAKSRNDNPSRSRTLELEQYHKNGTTVWTEVAMRFINDNAGRPISILGVTRDITIRKQTDMTITKERDRAQQYLDIAGVMFLAIDKDQNVTMINQKGCEILGYEEHEVVGKNWFDHFIKAEDIEQIKDVFNQMISDNIEPIEYYENSVLVKNGKERNIAWHNSIIRDEFGRITGTLSSGEDITDRKQIEAHLQQSQKMEAIGTLAGGIAHDFNNILSAIFGYSELTLSDVEPGTLIHGNLSKILKAGERARDLVQQILIFSRQSDRELLPVRIKLVVKEVLKFIRASLPTSIEIRQNLKNNPTVMADPTQIHQIIMNLCTNAGHAIEDEGGILEIGLETLELDSGFTEKHSGLQTGNYIKLTVSDTGTGIPPENLERIFDPYFTTKEKGKGTGLGLATVHGIVKSNGGIITVESQVEKGTKFEVYLPSVVDSDKTKEDSESKLIGGRERILLVDDEQDIIEIEKQMLEKLGYTITATVKANEALNIFAKQPDQFDLVISDMTMPKMTGDKLASELMKVRPDISVLLCTGFSENMPKEKAASLGIKGYLMKPVTLENLSHVVRKVLDEKLS